MHAFFRRLFFASLLIGLALIATSNLMAQSQVTFGAASSTGAPDSFGYTFGLEDGVGLAAQPFNQNLIVWFRGNATDPSNGRTYFCGYEYILQSPAGLNCEQGFLDDSDGPGQLTVFKGSLYMAYAAQSTRQLVICVGTAGTGFNYCNYIPGAYVADSPAIAVTPDGNELDVAYQENGSNHHLGIFYSNDGMNFHGGLTSYQIGHTPAMVAFHGNLIIAAFCQCDSHALNVFTSSGQGVITSMMQYTNMTLSNASPPSLAVAGNVLVLGYMQNGYRYFQISTSYDGITWTAPVAQTNIVNAWAGPALAVFNNQLYLYFSPQGTTLGNRQLAYSTAVLPH